MENIDKLIENYENIIWHYKNIIDIQNEQLRVKEMPPVMLEWDITAEDLLDKF